MSDEELLKMFEKLLEKSADNGRLRSLKLREFTLLEQNTETGTVFAHKQGEGWVIAWLMTQTLDFEGRVCALRPGGEPQVFAHRRALKTALFL